MNLHDTILVYKEQSRLGVGWGGAAFHDITSTIGKTPVISLDDKVMDSTEVTVICCLHLHLKHILNF